MAPMKARSSTRRIVSGLVVMAIMTTLFVLTRSEQADIVFLNGRVYALDAAGTAFEAFAVSGGVILELGSSDGIRGRYDADSSVDLEGRAVIPGFVDAHARLMDAGILALTVDVSRAGSAREAAALVGAHAAAVPPGTWIRGRGWKNAWWDHERERPSALLDSEAREHPVILMGEDESAAWVNSLALTASGIGTVLTEHEPGTIVRNRKGEPLGILLDEAAALVTGSLPPPTDWELNAALDSAGLVCLRAGITTVHDFGLGDRELALYEKRAASGTLPVRIYAVIGAAPQSWEAWRTRGPVLATPGEMLTVRARELTIDGALEPRGAALLEPYADDAATRGLTFADERELAAAARETLERGFQVCMNATGDRAVRIALNAYAQAADAVERRAGMLRLEGVQLARGEDLVRAAALGAVVSMQPARYALDFDLAAARLGPERMARFLPWDEAAASGLALAGGTDMPLAPAEPFLGISVVASRSTPRDESASGPDTLRALRDALVMFTGGSARAGLEQERKGSLEPGKLADFLVLSEDPLCVGAGRLDRIQIQATVLGGRVVYEEGRKD